MSNEFSDREIVATLAVKMHREPKEAEYDDQDKLIKLDLSGLNLTHLPGEIGQLRSLQELSLAGNQLKQLPLEMGGMDSLQKLDVNKNPDLALPPPEITEQGTTAILDFLRELQKESVPRYEAKLLLVGEPGAGKTSLLNALRGKDFVPGLPATDGIEIGRYQLVHPDKPGIDITLNAWDFGGQEIYHTTHQFFLTKRSLYLLVWNARTESKTSQLEYWLDIILSLAPDSRIILVATQIDLFPAQLDYRYYKENYSQIVDCVEVSSSTGKGINKLKAILAEVAANLPLMGQLWPRAWQDLEDALQEQHQPYLERKEYLSLCSAYRVNKEVASGTLGNYLHDLGKILYFQDDYFLSSLVILKPAWVTKAISRVLKDRIVSERGGILLPNDGERLWPEDEKEQYYKPYIHLIFIKLMERFHLSYQLENQKHTLQSLIPLLLPYDRPPGLEKWDSSMKVEQAEIRLVYDFEGRIVPTGIISNFIVSTQNYPQEGYWRNGLVLTSKEQQAKVEIYPQARQLHLQVRGAHPADFFRILMTHMDAILANFTHFSVKKMVPCICHQILGKKEPCDQLYRLNDLERRLGDKRLEVECLGSDQKIAVQKLLAGIIQTKEGALLEPEKEDRKAEHQLKALATTMEEGQQLRSQSTAVAQGQNATLQATQLISVVIQLRQGKDQQFDIEVHESPGGETHATAPLPFTSNELITILKALKPAIDKEQHFTADQVEILRRLELWDEESERLMPDLIEDIGKRLYRVLIADEIRTLFNLALQQGREQRKPVTLQIRFYEQDVELASYPWELLHDGRRSLVRSNAVELTRYISYPESVNTLPVTLPLRLLYIQSRPTNLTTLPTKEQRSLKQAMDSLKDKELLKIDVMEAPTYEKLIEFLENKDHPIHIIHFDGHGIFAKQCPNCQGMNYPHYEYCQNRSDDRQCNTKISRVNPKGYLALEDEQQQAVWIDSSTLGDLLYNHQVHLAVLSACRSSGVGGETLFSGNAPALIQAGVPAVVSVQLPVSADTANTFIFNFYNKLANLESIPAAVNSGRRYVMRTGEWFIPTLYLRNKDNKGYVFTPVKEKH